jgi:hypothetical protein
VAHHGLCERVLGLPLDRRSQSEQILLGHLLLDDDSYGEGPSAGSASAVRL